MIKLTKLFLTFSLFVFLSACGGDDEPTATDDSLIGTWKATSFSASTESTATVSGMTIVSSSDILGSDLDYEVTFDETSFTTNGSYTVSSTVTVNGMGQPTSITPVSDVSGNGTYSTSGNIMTIGGSFFEFEVQGIDLSGFNGEQMAEYEINANGELVFSQDETTETNDNGVNVVSRIISNSTWVKQ